MTNSHDWQHKFTADTGMQHRPSGAAQRTLASEADANLATQESLTAWIAEQAEVLRRAGDHLDHLRAVRTDLLRALDALDR